MSLLDGWKAEVEPLDGRKYYGSYVKLRGPNGEEDGLQVWVFGGHYEPSERELAEWDEDEYGP